MRKIYLFLILCCLSVAGYAQTAASYGLTATTGSYSSISGTGTSISAGGMISDNGVTTSISLPFTFSYCGGTYSSVSASANGWFSLNNSALGAAPSQTNATGSLSSIGSGIGLLMPLWSDLYGVSQTAYFQTTGTVGSRIFTIEWKNWSVCCAAGLATLNFQIKLYEGTNALEFWYGPFSGSVPTTATIGICNSTSDFQTLPAGTSTFSNTGFNSTCSPPANGTVLRWCAPPPAITGGTTSFCTGTTTTLADALAGGTWSSASPTVATVGSTTGVVTGISAGNAVISYTPLCGPSVTKTVTVSATPATFTMTGGGGYCSGAAGVPVGLNGSVSGITYSLFNGATLVTTVSPVSVAAFNFPGLQTASGTYTATATNGTCSSSMLGSVTVTVNPLPTQFSVTGGGPYCTGTSGATVGLSSSTIGVNYQLYVGATPVGSSFVGTSGALSFGPQPTTGGYTVIGTNATTLCSSIMSGTVTVTTSPLPTQFTVTGSGGYCFGGVGLPVGLPNSVTGTTYQLMVGGSIPVGTPVAGNTGSAISFGNQTSTSTSVYTVVATITATGCTATMSGSAVITVNPLPTSFSVYLPSGSGAFCVGGAGQPVGLLSSQIGVNYQLFNGTNPVGSPVAGTNVAISFGNQTNVGSYTVVATNVTTGCSNNMFGSVSITNLPLPSIFNVTGGGGYCAGGTGVVVGLGGSTSGINYSLYAGTTLVGAAPGSGSAISFPPQLLAGTYTVVANNPLTNCSSNMSGSVGVTINPVPAVNTVGGGGAYCAGGAGVPVTLSGSQLGVNYQLSVGGSPDILVAGTSSPLTFGNRFTAGSYAVVGTYAATGCSTNQTGSALITVNPLPTVYTETGGGGFCAGSGGVNIGLSASNTGINYQLYNSSGPVAGGLAAGTGFPISFGLQSTNSLIDYVVASNPLTTCTVNMSGNVIVTVNALPTTYTVTGGGSYCFGGAGVPVNLGGSQLGVNYQLYNGLSMVGLPITGTASPLVFSGITGAGTYSIVAVNNATGCTNNMTGSATVNISPLPSVFTVTGGGPYCALSGGVHVGLGSSSGGITYQLYNNGIAVVGASLVGTFAPLDFGLETVAGTYTIGATTPLGCPATMSGTATVSVMALPAAFTVTQTGASYCAGLPTQHVGLGSSAIGVSYQLYNGAAPVGTPMAGTGSALDFGVQTAGSFTIIGTNIATGCFKTMTGTGTITVTALPPVHNVTGGGGYCPGTGGMLIGLDGSEAGVNYQLYNGLTAVGGSVPGVVASPISFGLQTGTGIYTVRATNASSCVSNMAGSATISLFSLPIVYNITGGGNFCVGGTGANVGLSGSNIGVSYQLMVGTATAGTSMTGTGLPLNFGLQTVVGPYTIVATNNTTGCTDTMHGIANVDTVSLPTAHNVTGGGNYCAGGAGMHVGLDGSDLGTNYQLVMSGSIPVGTLVAGTGGALDFGLHTLAGSYTVVATNTSTTCTTSMAGSAVIGINTVPAAFAVSGGGPYCAGGPGVSVLLAASENTATYQLFGGTTMVGISTTGTGGAMTFGPAMTAGTYTIVATSIANGCTTLMAGTASVSINPLPNTYLVSGGGNYCAGSVGVHIMLSGSNAGINYQLKKGVTLTGTILAGTGMGLDFGPVTAAGNYTIQASNAVTGCINIMTGSTTVGINPLPVIHTVVSTSSSYCAGGAGVKVYLDTSDAGISYQLYNGSTAIGFPHAGTGDSILFGYILFPGSYTMWGTNNVTGCRDSMAPGVTVAIDPLPTVYAVTGGGAYCAGGAGVHVGVGGSNTGIKYKLYLGTSTLVDSANGTGAAIDFGMKTAAGTYRVVAVNNVTLCTSNMSGSAIVSIKALPSSFTITGGGTYCAGGAGLAVNLSGSDLSVNYQLINSGSTLMGSAVAGTGSGITFGPQTVAGTYSVIGTSTITGCSKNMSASALININPLPVTYSITGGGGFCPGGTGVNVGVSGSNSGVNYQLYNGSTAVGIPMVGLTGTPVNFGLQTSAGSYTVIATSSSTGCSATMSGTAMVVINALPTAYNVVGGGSFCFGGTGVAIGLSNTATGVNYTLYNGISTMSTMAGTGGPLSFGPQTLPGTYKVLGTSSTTSCTNYMSDSAIVVVNPIVSPAVTVSAGSGGDTICQGTFTTFTALTSGGGGTPSYQWSVNGSPAASGASYGYVPVNGDVVSVTLTSSETCAMPTTATNSIAMTVDPKETPFVTVAAAPGTEVCQGTVVNFTATPGFGGSSPGYQWFKDTVNVGSGTTFSYTPANGDIVYCAMVSNYHCRLANGATSTHLTMKVDVPATPVVFIAASPGNIISNGQTVTLSTTVANAGPAPTYQWLINGTPVGGATNATFTSSLFADMDSVTCQVLSSGGCAGLLGFNSITMHVANVGVHPVSLSGSDISLIPNPNKGIFTLKGSLGSGVDEEVSVEAVNMLGQVIFSQKIVARNGEINEHIELGSSLVNGMYILNLRSGTENKTFHFVVEQ